MKLVHNIVQTNFCAIKHIKSPVYIRLHRIQMSQIKTIYLTYFVDEATQLWRSQTTFLSLSMFLVLYNELQ